MMKKFMLLSTENVQSFFQSLLCFLVFCALFLNHLLKRAITCTISFEKKKLTLSVPQTRKKGFANSVDPNRISHQDLHCFFVFFFVFFVFSSILSLLSLPFCFQFLSM